MFSKTEKGHPYTQRAAAVLCKMAIEVANRECKNEQLLAIHQSKCCNITKIN